MQAYFLSERKLLVHVRNAVASTFDFITEKDSGQ